MKNQLNLFDANLLEREVKSINEIDTKPESKIIDFNNYIKQTHIQRENEILSLVVNNILDSNNLSKK